MANTALSKLKEPALVFKVKLEGSDLADRYCVQSIKVHHAINKLSAAKIILSVKVGTDSDSTTLHIHDDFHTGQKVEILSGYSASDARSIYEGIIVKYMLKLKASSQFFITIECKNIGENTKQKDTVMDFKILPNDVSGSNMKIECDEEKKTISLFTPANNSIIINDEKKSIEIKDEHNNSIVLNADGIIINSAKDIKFSASGNIEMTAKANIIVTAKAELGLKGLNVKATADIAFLAKGEASAELSATGQTTVKGTMVLIN